MRGRDDPQHVLTPLWLPCMSARVLRQCHVTGCCARGFYPQKALGGSVPVLNRRFAIRPYCECRKGLNGKSDRISRVCRKLQTAQAKLSKLQKEREAQEAAKALAAEEASASQQLPESSGEASASAEGPAEAPSSSASRTTAPEAAVPSTADEGRAAYVSERPFVSLSDLQDFAGVARAQRGDWSVAQYSTLRLFTCSL